MAIALEHTASEHLRDPAAATPSAVLVHDREATALKQLEPGKTLEIRLGADEESPYCWAYAQWLSRARAYEQSAPLTKN